MFRAIFFFFILFSSDVFAVVKCSQGIVDRAGVALIKKYSNASNGIVVIMGQDSYHHKVINGKVYPLVNFFAGKVEKNHQSSIETAITELREETSGGYSLSMNALVEGNDPNYLGYAYSGDHKPQGKNTPFKNYIQIFFYRDDSVSAVRLTKGQKKACRNKKLPWCLREMNASYEILLSDLRKLVKKISVLDRSGNLKALNMKENYLIKARSKRGSPSRVVCLDMYYVRNLARSQGKGSFFVICDKLLGKK